MASQGKNPKPCLNKAAASFIEAHLLIQRDSVNHLTRLLGSIAFDNLNQIALHTEQISKQPLIADEQKAVERMKILMTGLWIDEDGEMQPPLTIEEVLGIRQEIESLLQQSLL